MPTLTRRRHGRATPALWERLLRLWGVPLLASSQLYIHHHHHHHSLWIHAHMVGGDGMVWSSWSWCPLPGWGWWACPRSCQRSRPSARRLCPCHLAEDQVEMMIVSTMTINDIYNNPDKLQSGCWPWRLKAQPVLEKAWRLERGSAISYFWGSRSGSGSQ